MATIREIMTKNVRTCSLQDNVFEVAKIMREEDIGAVPIVEGKKVVGIVTDRDIVVRGLAEKEPGSTTVEKVMSTNLVTGSPDMSVHEAAEMMANQEIRRLPIVEGDNQLVGIVALGDLAARTRFSDMAGNALQDISESPKTLN